jgi:DNA (cytosine-5)-methyltransferase 1
LAIFVDLFSGCGGLSLGFTRAGHTCALAVDNDEAAVSTYNTNLSAPGGHAAMMADLAAFRSKFDVSQFVRKNLGRAAAVDILVGGPPCQSFSVVGRNKIRALARTDGESERYWQQRNRERTRLYEAYALAVEVLRPRFFVFENVPGIRTHAIFPELLARFRGIRVGRRRQRYHLHFEEYIASDYGIPQNRRRFVLVGELDIGQPRWTSPPKAPKVTVKQALGDLPHVDAGHRERMLAYGSRPTSLYQRLMRAGAESHADVVSDHVCRWHNTDDVALFGRMRPGARFADPDVQQAVIDVNPDHKLLKYSTEKFRDKLHRLDPKRPAWTVTAHLQKDCYKFIHFSQPRTITVREAARLQSFPDAFQFSGVSMVTAFRLIGNAVPPLFAEAFARSLPMEAGQ